MPVCENCNKEMKSVYKHMEKTENKVFYRCSSCGLLWAPELSTNISFRSSLNEESRQDALAEIRFREFEQVNRLIGRYVKKGSRGLDVGCAYGWYLKSVGSDYQMEGIEPEPSIAEKARESGHTIYSGFFPSDMPKAIEKYDFIVFNNVWEHINHTTELIKDSIAYLHSGGVMVITIPLSTGGIYRLAELFERAGRTKELARLWQLHFHSPHIYYFTKRNIEQVMEKYNCTLLECQDVRDNIDPKRMKQRFEMDKEEKHSRFKAIIFRILFPILKRLPADKAVFVFQFAGNERKVCRK